MNRRIVQQAIRQLLTQESGNRIVWDSELRGFGVRITAAGIVSFILDYRIHGRQRRYTIRPHPEFTATAPRLGGRRLRAVGGSDVAALHAALRPTPYQANRVLGLLSAIFNYGIKNKWTTENPARGIQKFHEEKRERFLTIEEMQKLRESIEGYSDVSARNALLLLMLTGSREGEVLKAEWEQFDLARGVWTKPFSNTKQKRVEHIPLSPAALKLLQSMMPMNATGPLFPGRSGGARVSLIRPWRQVCKTAGLVEEIAVEGKRGTLKRYRPTLRVHDLRHNFASHLASNGVSLQVVGKLLGHSQIATTMRYSHLQDSALRDATGVFGAIYEGAKKTGTKR